MELNEAQLWGEMGWKCNEFAPTLQSATIKKIVSSDVHNGLPAYASGQHIPETSEVPEIALRNTLRSKGDAQQLRKRSRVANNTSPLTAEIKRKFPRANDVGTKTEKTAGTLVRVTTTSKISITL